MAHPLRHVDLVNRMRGALHLLMPVGLHIGARRTNSFASIERDGLRAECLRDWPAASCFAAEWESLSGATPSGHPFQSPIWQQAVADQFVPRNQFRLITVYRGSELKAVLPLGFSSNGLLETPGRYVSDYLDPTFCPDDEPACWNIILELLARLWDWSVAGVVLANVRAEARCRMILPTVAAQHRFTIEEKQVGAVARIRLPRSWDEYLESLNSHERKEVRRKMRNAITKGGAELVSCTDVNEITASLKRALTEMELGSKPRKARFTEEALRPLLLGAAPALFEAGKLKLLNLKIEGKACASLFILSSAAGPMIYNTSYEPGAKQWSPGAVIFGLAIQQAIEQNAKVFDLLRGTEDYKIKIGATTDPLYRILLRRN